MIRERLTPERIRKFSLPEGARQAFLWDNVSPRLGVRVTAGSKAFIFEMKIQRKTIRRTIGDVRAWPIDNARVEANRLQTMVDQGIDPRELDRQEQEAKESARQAGEAAKADAEKRKRFTLNALLDAYVAHLKGQGKVKTARDAKSAFNCHVLSNTEVAGTQASEVTDDQIAALVRKVREAGKERTAGILRNYLVAAFNAARRARFDSSVSSALIEFRIQNNPAEVIPAIPVKRGNRTLSTDELRAYLKALADDDAGVALRVALLAGGQRMMQLLRATKGDYDDEAGTLRLWDGKGKRTAAREHLLPLGAKAKELVNTLAEKRTESGALLFGVADRTTGDRVSEIAKGMGGEPFDLRDLRRTCETMLAALGIHKDVRAQLLSHGISGVQAAHYDRHDYLDEKRAALVAWEAKLTAIEKGEKSPGNVVKLKRKTAA